MKKFLLILLVVLTAAPALAEDIAIGIVDLSVVQKKAGVYQNFAKKREAMYADFQKAVEKEEADLGRADKELAAKRDDMTQDEFAKKVDAFAKRVAESRRKMQERKANLDKKLADDFTKLAKSSLQPVINKVAESRNLKMVIGSGAALFYADSLDITDEVMKELNR